MVKTFEDSLVRYETELAENPESFFFAGLVKQTKEYIEELKSKF
jgi:hypothetical protein